MFIRDAFTRLTLVLEEVDATGVTSGATSLPDLRLKARLRSSTQSSRLMAFSALTDRIWLSGPDCALFLNALSDLNRTRCGSAEIASQSPDSFRLRIAATDRAGHILAEGHVGGSFLGVRQQHIQSSVCYSIEIGPTYLPQLFAAFRALLALPDPLSVQSRTGGVA